MTFSDYQMYTVPGLGGSAAGHWQTLWEREQADYIRIVQDDWDRPVLDEWSARVIAQVNASARPALFIAHSFGCLAVAHAAPQLRRRVIAALLVAPPDPDHFGVSAGVSHTLGFPAIVAASRNDPWFAWEGVAPLAVAWGARLVGLGACGHVNAESGLGPWPRGRSLLAELISHIEFRAHSAAA